MRLGFRSIRVKLMAVILATTFCALLIAGSVILVYEINSYRADRVRDMATQIELLASSSATAMQFGDVSVATDNLNLLEIREGVIAAALYDVRGRLFASYARNEDVELPRLPGFEGLYLAGDGLTINQRIIINGEIIGTAYIYAEYELTQRVLNFVGIFALVALGAMLVAALVSMWLQRTITRPIRSMMKISEGVISRRDYSQRAEKTTHDELGVLVDAVNEMLDQIELRTNALQTSYHQLEQEAAERQRARDEVLRLNAELEQKVIERTRDLEVANRELESFCYSVSHDLRAPLRSISGFSQALKEELPAELSGDATRYLDKIMASTMRMGQLIDDLLNLSRVSRGELERQEVNFGELSRQVIQELENRFPERSVDVSIWDGIMAQADPKLLRIVLENLLDNAFKFTARQPEAKIEIGAVRDGEQNIYFIRDNGAGFDMRYSSKLFGAFQRLHTTKEFPGTGVGLATVQRIINRHGGRIWADSVAGKGTVFYFSLERDRLGVPEASESDIPKRMLPRLRSV